MRKLVTFYVSPASDGRQTVTATAMVRVPSQQTGHRRGDLPGVAQFHSGGNDCSSDNSETAETRSARRSLQQVEEALTILVIGEDRPVIVAPVHEAKADFFSPTEVAQYMRHDGRLLRTTARRPWCSLVHNVKRRSG